MKYFSMLGILLLHTSHLKIQAISMDDVPFFKYSCQTIAQSLPSTVFKYHLGFEYATMSIDTESVGSNWSNWSTEYNITAINDTLTKKVFYQKYGSLGTNIGLQTNSLMPGGVTINCRFNLTSGNAKHIHDAGMMFSINATVDVPLEINKTNAGRWYGYIGLMLSRLSDGSPAIQKWADYNRNHYFCNMSDMSNNKMPQLFPIVDMFQTDSDVSSRQDALQAMNRMGINSPTGNFLPVNWKGRRTGNYPVLGGPGEFRKKGPEGGVVPCYDANSSCTLHDYCTVNATDADIVNDTDIKNYAKFWIPTPLSKQGDMAVVAMADEPGWKAPLQIPVQTSSVIRKRWQTYLQRQQLTPSDLGASTWDEVLPIGRGDAGAGNLSGNCLLSNISCIIGDSLPKKRLFYWSVRFAHWDSATYMAKWSQALQNAAGDPTLRLYVNWNNFDGRMYVPGNGLQTPTNVNVGGMSYDWFEWARVKGGTILWTEDWMGDAATHRWSYYASRLRSAAALAEFNQEFSGYIVGRSSGLQEGGLLQRPLTLVGSGAKVLRYYNLGPEYMFPANCYSDVANATRLIHEIGKANDMIARAEPVLWPARRDSSQVAILFHRSSEMWDEWSTDFVHDMCMCCCTSSMVAKYIDYSVEVYGLYLALATDSNIPVDFLDEDALEDSNTLAKYKVVIIAEPNIPTSGMSMLVQWMKKGGILLSVSGAGVADRYNEPSDILQTALGITESTRQRYVFRQDHTLPSAANGTVNLPEVTTPQPFSARGPLSNLTIPAGSSATMLGKFVNGDLAITQNVVGNGKGIKFSWMPGISYWFSQTLNTEGNKPRNETLRSILASIVLDIGKVEVPVSTSMSRVETPLLITPDRKAAVVTLLNFQAGLPLPSIPTLQLNVSLPFQPASVASIEHGNVEFTSKEIGGKFITSLTLPLQYADFIIFKAQEVLAKYK
eukprot:m.30479 g.30479  ORF g.30479 m.30479 type:complete len:944 (+) comp8204_c0_seq3:119-2950(+)